jgi:hypothetical protein
MFTDDKVVWEVKRYRLEGTTLLEFAAFNPDQIAREISLEGVRFLPHRHHHLLLLRITRTLSPQVLLFKNVGDKVGLPAAAPCICLESLGLAQANARTQLKKVGVLCVDSVEVQACVVCYTSRIAC